MQLSHRLSSRLPHATQPHQAQLSQLGRALMRGATKRLTSDERRLDALEARLHALDPKQVLARGYAWLSDGSGRAVISIERLAVGAALRAVLSDGSADVLVTDVSRTSA